MDNLFLTLGLKSILALILTMAVLRIFFKNTIVYQSTIVIVVSFILLGINTNLSANGYINTWLSFIIYALFTVSTMIFINFNLRKPLSETIDKIKKFSEGDMTIEIVEKQKNNELGQLNKSLLVMKNNISNIITNVEGGAKELFDSALKLNNISSYISAHATQQAGTVEEIATSMEEMLATVSSNLEKAKITGNISDKSVTETQNTNAILQQTLELVKVISDKVHVVSDIANKTDILSINAAIEAAGAGENGKGFSVVAQEIRKLADKTKVASVQITDLSQKGHDISEKAGEKLQKLIPDIVNSSKHVNEIIQASSEQQASILSINEAIQQLTITTNESSATAEEMLNTAETLNIQAEKLKAIVSKIRVN